MRSLRGWLLRCVITIQQIPLASVGPPAASPTPQRLRRSTTHPSPRGAESPVLPSSGSIPPLCSAHRSIGRMPTKRAKCFGNAQDTRAAATRRTYRRGVCASYRTCLSKSPISRGSSSSGASLNALLSCAPNVATASFSAQLRLVTGGSKYSIGSLATLVIRFAANDEPSCSRVVPYDLVLIERRL